MFKSEAQYFVFVKKFYIEYCCQNAPTFIKIIVFKYNCMLQVEGFSQELVCPIKDCQNLLEILKLRDKIIVHLQHIIHVDFRLNHT